MRKRKNKKDIRHYLIFIIAFLFGGIIALTIGFSATILYNSSEVKYNNTNSGMTSTNVQGAIDELKSELTSATDATNLISEIYEGMHPVGSIYISVNSTNPATIFGGTWEAFGTGRALFGVDTAQTEFSTIEKTGGDKNMQSHTHTFYAKWVERDVLTSGGADTYRMAAATSNCSVTYYGTGAFNYGCKNHSGNNYGTSLVISGNMTAVGGDGGASYGNLQPYITVYMWKRTS